MTLFPQTIFDGEILSPMECGRSAGWSDAIMRLTAKIVAQMHAGTISKSQERFAMAVLRELRDMAMDGPPPETNGEMQ